MLKFLKLRLFKFVMNENLDLYNESYVLYDRVMHPLTAQQERKTRNDHDMRRGRHSTSSFSAFDQPSSSHLNDNNDGNDEGTSRATKHPSPFRFVNSQQTKFPRVLFKTHLTLPLTWNLFTPAKPKSFTLQVQLRDELHGGLRSIGKGLRNLWRNMKK
ncbi:hypothetical protein Tco_0757678 [Tanacetum coccineum]